MLIAQEMSSAFESKEKPPGVVAKLMGLSKLPVQQKVQTLKTNLQEIDSHDGLSRVIRDYWKQEEGSCNHQMLYRSKFCMHEKYKDVYELKQHLSSNGQIKNHKLQNEACHENLMEKRMALVHQKFILAKRLATNKRLIQSKEFKDALEVLSSNRDLFLKFLEEPNSLFSKQLNEFQQIISLGSQSKRITVLKPATSFDSDHKKCMRKNRCACGEEIRRNTDVHGWSSSLFIPKAETISQPTKIVVLRPSPTVLHETKTNMTSNITESVRESRHRSGILRTGDDTGSREAAMKIAWKNQKDLRSMQKDEYPSTAFSSSFYPADEGTLNRSENDRREEWGSDCSDSELVTPTSQNSWVHERSINLGSVNSCSHQSHSAESLEGQEAKKRLSERWVLATSNAISHEEADIKKISSTLGDILAIPEVKKEEEMVNSLAISPWVSCGQVPDKSIKGTCLPTSRMQESSEDSLKSITRLKSLPNYACHEKIRLNEEISCTLSSKSILLKEFSKSPKENCQFTSPPVSVNRTERHGNVSFKGIRSIEKLWKSEISREKFNQQSAISVLERPFQEAFSINISHSAQNAITGCKEALSRSPLINSVSRSKYSEKMQSASIPPNSLKLSKLFSKEDEEREQLDFIQKLISTSNLADERSNLVLAKSHSLDCPLDPILLDDLLEREGEEDKYMEKRSNHKLLFDCVTVALKEIGHSNLANAYPWSTKTIMDRIKTGPTVTIAVLCRLKDCFSEEENCIAAKNNKQFVDYLVKKEVIRSGLVESMWLEMDEFNKEIGESILKELFDDALADLIGCCLC